jgi:hypothetical protein
MRSSFAAVKRNLMLIYRKLFVVLVLVLSVGASASAEEREVYRWVDTDGKVHFADRPLADDAQRLDVDSRATDNKRINEARQARIERKLMRQEAKTEQAKTQKAAAEEAERKAENCRRARAALESLVNARRLYEPADDGSRRYLDEAQIAQRRAKAREDVAQWCN